MNLLKMKNKKAAMEMSVGTLVTIVLLMIVLVLGVFLVRQIFGGATESVDSINQQVRGEIDNLFNTENQDIVVSLGAKHSAKVKQGTEDFGFVTGFAPDDPTGLDAGNCKYSISVSGEQTAGTDYCTDNGVKKQDIEGWFKTGRTNVQFDQVQKSVGYALIRLDIPDSVPTCVQRFKLEVTCSGANSYSGYTWFDIEILKKGFLGLF